MEIVEFLRELAQDVPESNWERTDTGYQLVGHDFTVKLRREDNSSIEILVQSFDNKEIFQANQQSSTEGSEGEISAWLALLYQRIDTKPARRDAALDEVLRDIRRKRGQ